MLLLDVNVLRRPRIFFKIGFFFFFELGLVETVLFLKVRGGGRMPPKLAKMLSTVSAQFAI